MQRRAIDFHVDSKKATYEWTDVETGVTTKRLAGNYKETNQYNGSNEYLTRDYENGWSMVCKPDNSWSVTLRQDQATRIIDGDKQRLIERDANGKINKFTDTHSNRVWNAEVVGDLYVDARGLCVIKQPDGSFKKLDMDGNLAALSRDEHLRALAASSKDLPNDAKARFAESVLMMRGRGGTSQKEIDDTIESARRLLEEKSSGPFTPAQRHKLAEQLIWHTARPSRQEQGQNPTCTLSAARTCMTDETPGSFAKMIADIGLTGKFVAWDGSTIVPPIDSLKMNMDTLPFPPQEGNRTWLGQVSDITMGNLFWQRQTVDTYGYQVPKGSLVYSTFIAQNGVQSEHVCKTDNGRIAYELKNRADNFVAHDPLLYPDDLIDLYSQVTRKDEKGRVIVSSNNTTRTERAAVVKSEAELEKELSTDPRRRIIMVHTSHDPFYQDSGFGTAGGSGGRSGGWHAVATRGFDRRTSGVAIDNSWQPDKDHVSPGRQIKLPTVYAAMNGPA